MCVSVCVCVCVSAPVLCLQALEISPSTPPPPVSVFVLFFKFLVLHVMHTTIFSLVVLTLRYCLPNVSLPAPLSYFPQFYLPHACRQCLMSTPWAKKQVPLTHSQTALQDTGCAVSTGALNILHFTKIGSDDQEDEPRPGVT